MGVSVRIILLFLALSLTAAESQNAPAASAAVRRTAAAVAPRDVLFRNYALAVCVADGYTSQEIKIDASAVANGYLENGSYPLEAYNDAREEGRKFLAKEYPSIANAKLTLMKCIDFSQSQEVGRIMRKYGKTR